MTRSISKSLSKILEELELENDSYVSLDRIRELVEKHEISSDASVVASRLKQLGWLLPTSQRGIWEFASAAMAGPYSKNDPLREIIAFNIANPQENCYLCMQTAAWVLGYADRVPTQKELAFQNIPRKHISEDIIVYKYTPSLTPKFIRGVKCLVPESIIVHMATKPDSVKNWESVIEWLPDMVYDINIEHLLIELDKKNDSIKRRTGYLLQGMHPNASEAIKKVVVSKSKIRFGPRKEAIRNDERWMISDTILPFSPKEIERVK